MTGGPVSVPNAAVPLTPLASDSLPARAILRHLPRGVYGRAFMFAAAVSIALVGTTPAAAHDVPWAANASAAEELLELEYRWVDPVLVDAARRELGYQLQIGEPGAVAEAKRGLIRAKAGLRVDLARCRGSGQHYGKGLYKHFRCRLDMSLGSSYAEVLGTFHVTGRERFKFHRSRVIREY